jgi:hypothetical protein
MSSNKERIYALIGNSIKVNNDLIGTVTEVFEITNGSDTQYVCVFDSGRKVDGYSILRMISSSNLIRQAQSNTNHVGTSISFPDGTAYSKYFVGAKAKHLGNAVCAANIDNIAIVGDEKINITTHLSSSDNCE